MAFDQARHTIFAFGQVIGLMEEIVDVTDAPMGSFTIGASADGK